MSEKLELVGVLIKKFEVQKVTASMEKREFVIETEEQYPQQVKFELINDKCRLIDGFNEGNKLKVSFNVRGREWQGKYFVNLGAWRIEIADGSNAQQTPANTSNQSTGFTPKAEPLNTSTTAIDDDLPF